MNAATDTTPLSTMEYFREFSGKDKTSVGRQHRLQVIEQLHKEGYSSDDVINILGLSREVIRKDFRTLGIDLRMEKRSQRSVLPSVALNTPKG